jgi:putative membrane protein
MKTLILNIDRDNDFGRKAKIESPIIGIKNNINAANKLGEIDPEDSDLNAIFYAISTYKTLEKEEQNVEIATICGDISVGLKSDQILTKQLEDVIKKTEVNDVILISDGAEDEYILPIVQSRIKISSVQRVSVKQSRELEDTYYRILKILDDPKVQKQFFLPIALVLIVGAFFVLLGMASSGFGAILLTLGGYLLIRVFRWEKRIAFMWEEVKSGFLTGKLSIYTTILAGLILAVSGFLAYDRYNKTLFSSESDIIPVLFFINNMIWGIVIAGLIAAFGRAVDLNVKDKKTPWNYWIVPFSLFAFGFISSAVFGSLYQAFINWPEGFTIDPFMTSSFIGYTTTGIMIAIVGAITYHYIKEIYMMESKDIEIEEQTKKLVDNN